MLSLKTALALAGHVRDVPIFLQIGSYTASLGLGLCLGKKKIKKSGCISPSCSYSRGRNMPDPHQNLLEQAGKFLPSLHLHL